MACTAADQAGSGHDPAEPGLFPPVSRYRTQPDERAAVGLPDVDMNVSGADWLADAEPTTILVVDNHGFLREGLCGLLRSESDLHVVGEADDSVTAAALAAQERPDIVLLDICVPGGDGGHTVSQIRASSPGSRVIVLTMHESPRLVREALAAGARGYLLKSICWQELVVAIRTVRADGDRVVLGVSRVAHGMEEQRGAEVLSARDAQAILAAADYARTAGRAVEYPRLSRMPRSW
jgi:DNA-binding NarL/FixJ family response regulator